MKSLSRSIKVLITAIYDLKKSINDLTQAIKTPPSQAPVPVKEKKHFHGQQTFTSSNSYSDKRLLEKVVKAFTDKGINPKYHDKMVARLKKDWPTLYSALSELSVEKLNSTTPIWKYSSND